MPHATSHRVEPEPVLSQDECEDSQAPRRLSFCLGAVVVACLLWLAAWKIGAWLLGL